MARYVGLTARRLRSRLAREGTSPARLLREFRCAAACAALREGQKTVGAIAERLGYSESSAFQRAFKRWTGASPIAYARAAAGTADPTPVHLQSASALSAG
jgi:AraC-like DNA-binding protein